jgi:peptidoglycan-associated lipoprotein
MKAPRIHLLPIIAFSIFLTTLILTSCSKKDVKMDEPLVNPSETEANAAQPSEPVDSSGASAGEAAVEAVELKTIYFDYDKFSLTNAGREDLKHNADWLKQNGNARVQIEGHCDERGTTEYNLALGERRANAVREFLMKMGIPKSRIDTISYGKERPSDMGHDDAAWAKNRRAVFVITSK